MQSAFGQPGTDLPRPGRVASRRLPARAAGSWRRRAGLSWSAFARAIQADRDLAAGTSSLPAEVLALRAQRITRRRPRLRLAGGLARALRSADGSTPVLTAAVRPNGREVLDARTVLSALERRLRTPDPVGARGMAMLRLLLTEPDSLLYRSCEPGALGSFLRAAAAELEPGRAGG
jgi:hypothetical protein